jgi:hypothetical protein
MLKRVLFPLVIGHPYSNNYSKRLLDTLTIVINNIILVINLYITTILGGVK